MSSSSTTPSTTTTPTTSTSTTTKATMGDANTAAHASTTTVSSSSSSSTSPSSSSSSSSRLLSQFSKYRAIGVDSTLGFMFCGGVSGTVSRTCAAPFERLKILFQVQDLGYAKNGASLASDAMQGQKYNGIVSGLVRIYKDDGFMGYFKGNGTNCFRVIPYTAAQFVSYEKYKKWMVQRSHDGKTLNTVDRLICGGLAGMTSVLVSYPLDVVRCRLSAQSETTSKLYSGIFNCLKVTYQQEGFYGLYRGLIPTLLGIAPYVALNFTTYEYLKTTAMQLSQSNDLGIVTKLSLGAISGTFAQTITYPLDVVRRRMQMQGIGGRPVEYTTLRAGFQNVYIKYGAKGFYKLYLVLAITCVTTIILLAVINAMDPEVGKTHDLVKSGTMTPTEDHLFCSMCEAFVSSERAKVILQSSDLIKRLTRLDQEGASLREQLPASLKSKLTTIIEQLPNTISLEAWKLLCVTADIEGQRVNKMAQLWRSHYVADHTIAIHNWSFLIYGFRANINKTRVVFLLKPIKSAFEKHLGNSEFMTTTFATWIFLITSIIQYAKSPWDEFALAFDCITKAYDSLRTLVEKDFISLITDIPKEVLEVHWRIIAKLDDQLITQTLIDSLANFGFRSAFNDYLTECVSRLQKKNNSDLWMSLCTSVSRLLASPTLDIPEDKTSTHSNSKIHTSSLYCTIEHLLLHPIKNPDDSLTTLEALAIWKQLLNNTSKLLKFINSPPRHYPDSNSINNLKIAHVDNLLAEVAPHIKYVIALSDSEDKTPNVNNVVPLLGVIVDELHSQSEFMCANKGSFAEKVFTDLWELWILFLERKIVQEKVLEWAELCVNWCGFCSFLQKAVTLPCADMFSKFWKSILTSNFNVHTLCSGLESPSKLIQDTTLAWYEENSSKWTDISESDFNRVKPLLLPKLPARKVTFVEFSPIQKTREEEDLETVKAHPKFKRIDTKFESDSDDIASPSTPTHDSLLSLGDSPIVDVMSTPSKNSPMILKSVTKKKRSEIKKRPIPGDPPARVSTAKKRKVSKSKFVMIEDTPYQELDIPSQIDVEKRKEQRMMFKEFNPTLPSLEAALVTPKFDRSLLGDPTPSTIRAEQPVRAYKNEDEVETLFSDLNTGCTPAKPTLQDSPLCISGYQPRVLFQDAPVSGKATMIKEEDTAPNTSTSTLQPKAEEEKMVKTETETEDQLKKVLVDMEVDDAMNNLKTIRHKLQLLESSDLWKKNENKSLQFRLLSIQREAMEIALYCGSKLEQFM